MPADVAPCFEIIKIALCDDRGSWTLSPTASILAPGLRQDLPLASRFPRRFCPPRETPIFITLKLFLLQALCYGTGLHRMQIHGPPRLPPFSRRDNHRKLTCDSRS